MDSQAKHDLYKMLLPMIGTWWLLKLIIPVSKNANEYNWWDYYDYTAAVASGLALYQAVCWIGYKVFHMMYFFDYNFEQVFLQW